MTIPEGMPGRADPVEFLCKSVGPEAGFYVESMRQLEPSKFAVIKVGGDIVENDLRSLVRDVAMLSELGLYPVIVHGGKPQIDAELEKHNIEKNMIDGVRVTDKETLQCVETGLGNVNKTLVESLGDEGVDAVGLDNNVFTAHYKDKNTYQFTGETEQVDTEAIQAAVKAGKVPIVSCMGHDTEGQLLNINGDEAARALGAELGPHKFIMLSNVPGVVGRDGKVMSVLNGEDEASKLTDDGTISEGMVEKVKKGLQALHGLPADSSVVITNPAQLMKELFTYEGGGTLLRHHDEIKHLPSVEAVDQQEVQSLIEEVFGKQLVDDYFENLPDDAEIYITDRGYRGMAIVWPNEDDQPAYIDKLAVRKAERGHGMGDEIIDAVRKKHHRGVFLRASKSNPYVLDYYRSPGRLQEYQDLDNDEWAVFFSQEVNPKERKLYAQIAASLPRTLVVPKHNKSQAPLG